MECQHHCLIFTNTQDPRAGKTGFVQGSTCGYFGHAYANNVLEAFESITDKSDTDFPDTFDAEWYVYQGETDITSQVVLGDKGQLAQGRDATRNWDSTDGKGKVTFEDIDGLEVFEAADGNLYVMIQEDSGNDYGERMFISSPLEHVKDENDLNYYFVAMSGGVANSRGNVGVPKGTACGPTSHEFSGLFDLSGLLLKLSDGEFVMSATDNGQVKRASDRQVAINDKLIYVGLQAASMACGVIEAFQADRGGQWLVYQPELPTM